MSKMLERIRHAFEWLDGVEVVVVGIIAAVLIVVGPVYWIIRFSFAKHYVPAVLVGLLWLSCLAAFVRDVRRQRFSWITVGLVAIWIIAMLLVGLNLE